MSSAVAWKRSRDEALADERKKNQMSKSKTASLDEDSEEEIIIKKQAKQQNILAHGDSDKTRARQSIPIGKKQKEVLTTHTTDYTEPSLKPISAENPTPHSTISEGKNNAKETQG